MSEYDQERVKADFHLKEYEAMRREVEGLQSTMRANELHAVLATVAVWTWLATHGAPAVLSIVHLAWWLPLGVDCLCFLRNVAFLEGMVRLSRRMADVEGILEVRGWETVQGEQREPRFWKQIQKGPYRYTYLASALFWVSLSVATLVIPFLVGT